MPAHPVGEPLRGSLLRTTTKCDQVALTRGAQLFSTRATMTLTRSVSEGERFTGLFDESRQPSVRPRSRFGLVCAFPNVSSSPARRITGRGLRLAMRFGASATSPELSFSASDGVRSDDGIVY